VDLFIFIIFQPLQQGFEEVGDDGIVPSTPTLSVPVRREGFGEGMVLPQVPQTQNQHFTFTAEPSQNDEAGGSFLADFAMIL
jgi:hypothetical protein